MRKIFLDCGTHFGQGLAQIATNRAMDNTWEIMSWEANPITFCLFDKTFFRKDLNITFFNQAIGINNEKIILNVETTKEGYSTGMGSSIIDLDKWNSPLHSGTFKEKVFVDSIDFSSFILENFTKDDHIILKMDIEGSEYNVLEKMINDSSLDLISEIYVEWHSWVFSNSDKEEILIREQAIINELNAKNIKMHKWY
jgi:FkbM family methyltransferase